MRWRTSSLEEGAPGVVTADRESHDAMPPDAAPRSPRPRRRRGTRRGRPSRIPARASATCARLRDARDRPLAPSPTVDWDGVFRAPPRAARDRAAAAGRPAVGRAGRARTRGPRHRARHGVRHRPARDHPHLPRGDRGAGGAGGIASALDVGTGSGILAAALARLGVPHVVALDVDAAVLPLARAMLDRIGAAHVRLFAGTARPCAPASTWWSRTSSPTRSSPKRRARRGRGAGRAARALGVARRSGRARRRRLSRLARRGRARRRRLAYARASSEPSAAAVRPGARPGRRTHPDHRRELRHLHTLRLGAGRGAASFRRRRRRARGRARARRRTRRRAGASSRAATAARVAARAGPGPRAAEGQQDGLGDREGDRARRAPHRAGRDARARSGAATTASAGDGSRSRPPSSRAARSVPAVDAPRRPRRVGGAPWPGLRLVAVGGRAERPLGRPGPAAATSVVASSARRAGSPTTRWPPRARRLHDRSRSAPRMLRAETAAIVAAALCQHRWGDGCPRLVRLG